MEDKINARFICLEEPAFYELIDTLYERINGKGMPEKWLTSQQVMAMLNVSSPSTMQKLRDAGAFRFTQPTKKMILYDRESVEEYLEKHAL